MYDKFSFVKEYHKFMLSKNYYTFSFFFQTCTFQIKIFPFTFFNSPLVYEELQTTYLKRKWENLYNRNLIRSHSNYSLVANICLRICIITFLWIKENHLITFHLKKRKKYYGFKPKFLLM